MCFIDISVEISVVQIFKFYILYACAVVVCKNDAPLENDLAGSLWVSSDCSKSIPKHELATLGSL